MTASYDTINARGGGGGGEERERSRSSVGKKRDSHRWELATRLKNLAGGRWRSGNCDLRRGEGVNFRVSEIEETAGGGVFAEVRPAADLETGGVEGRASCTVQNVVGSGGGERGR